MPLLQDKTTNIQLFSPKNDVFLLKIAKESERAKYNSLKRSNNQ
jgi:hypothetical protein